MVITNKQSSSGLLLTIGLGIIFIAVLVLLQTMHLISFSRTALQSGVVGNAAPSVDAVIPSDASGSGTVALPVAGFTLNEGATRNLYVRGTVSDPNGCEDIAGVAVTAYRSGATGGSGCTLDANDCYYATVAKAELVGCTGAGDTDATFEAAISVANFADPTDAGSPRAADTWKSLAVVSDAVGLQNSLAADFEVQSLAAFAVAPSLMDYGTIALGATSAQQTLTVTNTGNRAVNSYIRADGDMTSSLPGFATISASQTHYSVNQATAWADGTPIAAADSDLPLALSQQVADAGPAPTANAYFYLKLPASGIRGTYTNTLYFTAYAAGGGIAQGLSNGMTAMDVIGQYDYANETRMTPSFSSNAPLGGANKYSFYNPIASLVDAVNHRLITTESANNRVLIFDLNGDGTLIDSIPDHVLGQTDFLHGAANRGLTAPTASTLYAPRGLAWDAANSRLFVADASNSRVLIYDLSSVITDGMAASAVLGQSAMTCGRGNHDATCSASLSAPADLSMMNLSNALAWDADNNRLFVSDASNSRVLAFENLMPGFVNGRAATKVLGQDTVNCGRANHNPACTASLAAPTALTMNAPNGLAWDAANNRLFVADALNHRVLAFDPLTTGFANGLAASSFLGQPTGVCGLTNANSTCTASLAAPTGATMNTPRGVAWDTANNRLFVAEFSNHRVLAFEGLSPGFTGGRSATSVLGQAATNCGRANHNSDCTAISANPSAKTMNVPYGVTWDSVNSRLWVAEYGNHRFSSFDALPLGFGLDRSADAVLGQYVYSGWPLRPTTPSFALGGAHSIGSIYGLYQPRDVVIDPVRHLLFVMDVNNFRVLVYNLDADNNLVNRAPVHVIGQTSLSNVSSMGASASTFSQMWGIGWDSPGQRLFVVDRNSSRIMVFDLSAGITDGQAAAYVLGQSDMTTGTAGFSQTKMNNPFGVAYDATHQRLFVGDWYNSRVTIWDVRPAGSVSQSLCGTATTGIATGMNASCYLGGSGWATACGAVDNSCNGDVRLLAWDPDGQRLFAAGDLWNRILVYDLSGTITNSMAASYVLGQASFSTIVAGSGLTGLNQANGMAYDRTNQRLFEVDYVNRRILSYDVRPSGSAPVTVCGVTTTGIATGMTASCSITPGAGASATLGSFRHALSFDDVNQRLYAADGENNRVLIYDASSPANP